MTRVAMFVTNPCTHDARVMKEASTLSNHGYEVRVYALANAHHPAGVFDQDSYTIHRIQFLNIFKRVQNGMWSTLRFIFTPIRWILKLVRLIYRFAVQAGRRIGIMIYQTPRTLIWVFMIIVAGLLALGASVIRPFLPALSDKGMRWAMGLQEKMAARSGGVESVRSGSFVDRIKQASRRGRVRLNRSLKGRCSLRARIRAVQLYSVLMKPLAKLLAGCFILIRQGRRIARIAYSRTYSFLVRTRRRMIARINEVIFKLLLPSHKFTTYLFFCNKAAGHAIDWNANVAHAHDLSTLYAAKKVKQAIGAKVVYDSHELWVHRNRVDRNAFFEKKIDRWVENKLIRDADEIITVCESIGKWLAENYPGIPTPRILRNMPSGVDDPAGDHEYTSLKSRLGIPEQSKVMMYTGKLTPGRGIEIGVRVLAEIEDMYFVLLGYGEPGYQNSLTELVRSLGVEDRVVFCDAVPHSEVSKFIFGADFALVYIEPICLSYEYALPNKLFESIQAEVPIMGSGLAEIKRIVDGYDVGMCFVNTEDLVEKISSLDESQLEKWKQNTRLHRPKLCWEEEQKVLLDTYQSMALAEA